MNTSYSKAFLDGIGFVLPHENEYARGHWGDPKFVITENVPGDAGGKTKYGIDAASHPGVDIVNLTQDSATAIYWNEDWSARNLDALPEKTAIALFDVWVNGGHGTLWLQHAINVIYAGVANSFSLVEDGIMGPATIKAVQAGNEAEIISIFIKERNARFEAIAAANANDRQFLKGWEQRDADLEAYLTKIS